MDSPKPSLCAVVAMYHPDNGVVDNNLRAMVRECGQVVAVDNGSLAEEQARFATVAGVEVLSLGTNLGVAEALNRGMTWARNRGCAWVVTFDQDSEPVAGMTAALWAAHLRHPSAAVVGPRISEALVDVDEYRWLCRHPRWPGFFRRVRCRGHDLVDVTQVITSGSMIEIDLWERLGGFDQDLFIDYVDTDYCLRVRAAGREIVVAHDAVLRHRLGSRRSVVVLGRDLRPMHHAAFRHYYIARNRIILWRRHAWREPHWAVFDLSFALYNYCRVLLFEDQRWEKCKAIVRGTLHGLLGRRGPMP